MPWPEKGRVLMKAFITTNFDYCPIAWMLLSRDLNNKMNPLHERTLRITNEDKMSSFQNLLKEENSVSIHQRNLKLLATKVFKV